MNFNKIQPFAVEDIYKYIQNHLEIKFTYHGLERSLSRFLDTQLFLDILNKFLLIYSNLVYQKLISGNTHKVIITHDHLRIILRFHYALTDKDASFLIKIITFIHTSKSPSIEDKSNLYLNFNTGTLIYDQKIIHF